MGRKCGRSLRGGRLWRHQVVLHKLILLWHRGLSRCSRLGHMVRYSYCHLINRLHGVSHPSSLGQVIGWNTLYCLKVPLPPSPCHLSCQKLTTIPKATLVRELSIHLVPHKRRLRCGKLRAYCLRWEGVDLHAVRGDVWEGCVGEGCTGLESRRRAGGLLCPRPHCTCEEVRVCV